MINIKFMNKIKKILTFILIAGFAFNTLNTNAQAQGSVSETVATAAEVITPITITTAVAMDFGTLSVNGDTGGTLTLATDNTRTATDGVDLIGNDGASGGVTVTGLAEASFTVTIRETVMLREDQTETTSFSGANVMPLTAFTLLNNTTDVLVTTFTGSTSATALASGIFQSTILTGTSVLKIGATIALTDEQNTGTYVGEIVVDVAYD